MIFQKAERAASKGLKSRIEAHACGSPSHRCELQDWPPLACRLHKLDVKWQSLCGNGFSLFAMCMLAKPYHFGMN